MELRIGLTCLVLRNAVTIFVSFTSTELVVVRLIFVSCLEISRLVAGAIILLIVLAQIVVVRVFIKNYCREVGDFLFVFGLVQVVICHFRIAQIGSCHA